MPRETLEMVVDCPDRDALREFVGKCAPLKGQYRLTAAPCRLSLSQQQRGYYHGHVVKVFADWLERGKQPLPVGEDGRPLLSYHAYAHAWLKLKCLQLPVYNRRGELKGHITGSTEELDTAGMFAYVERARSYLWDTFRLYTDEPDPNWRDARRLPPDVPERIAV